MAGSNNYTITGKITTCEVNCSGETFSFKFDTAIYSIVSKYLWHVTRKQKGTVYFGTGSHSNRHSLAKIICEALGVKYSTSALIHLNGDNSDFTKDNLSMATPAQYYHSRHRNPRNTSGRTGVSQHSKDSKWYAYIDVNGTRYHLGAYKTREEAVHARYSAEIKYGCLT